MSIHREGYPTIILTGGIFLSCAILASLFLPGLFATIIMILSACGWLFFIQFFRNPKRTLPADCSSHCVISPADGKIVAIEPVHESEYFKDERLKISIYMSALNVHVNRVPIHGTVRYTHYHPGKYLVAYHPKSSELNERNTIVFHDEQGRYVLIRQIAGLLARRIVTYVKEGQSVTRGEELGFIKFGSRCDVFMPLDSTVKVSLQQAVKGGETILATLSEAQ